MRIDETALTREIEEALEANRVWMLATSLDDHVTIRPMSIVHDGLSLYFQTNRSYVKHEQMRKNPQVALGCNNISIEGTVLCHESWDAAGAAIHALYKEKHPGSYAKYGALEGQVVYQVIPTLIKLWKYAEGGVPYREMLSLPEGVAERIEFM